MNADDRIKRDLKALTAVKLSDTDKATLKSALRESMRSELVAKPVAARSYGHATRNKRRIWPTLTGAVAAAILIVGGLATTSWFHHPSRTNEAGSVWFPSVISRAYAYEKVAPSNFNEIQMTSARTGWGMGYNAKGEFRLIRTIDGGVAWQQIQLPVQPPKYDVTTQQIGQPGFALGTFLNGSIGWIAWIDDARRTLTVLETTDGGNRWRVSHTKVSTDAMTVTCMAMANKNHIWLLASSTAGLGQMQKFLFTSSDGGQHWSQVADSSHALPMSGTSAELWMSAPDGRQGWLTTGNMGGPQPNVFATTDGGHTWHRVDVPIPASLRQNSDAIDATVPRFVGQNGSFTVTYMALRGGADVDETVVYHSNDGGERWVAHVNPALTNIAVAHVLGNHGWVVHQHLVYRTTDGGQHWVQVAPLPTKDTSQYPIISALQFVDAKHGWLLLESTDLLRAKLERTSDGGRTWVSGP